MGGPIAHGVAKALREQREGGGAPQPPPRWRMWAYLAAIAVLIGLLALGWRYG